MNKKIKIFSTVSLAALACSLFANTAQAQAFDYGSFEAMFGEPVTTSATGSPQRSSEVPVNMTIVTADQIKRSGETNIPRILSHVAGMNVIEWGPSSYDVSVRGYNQGYNPRLLVMINGRQVYLDNYGFVSWSSIPVQLSEIRQIEVVKGPNAALFGFNAVGGVVNIITYNPLYDNTNVVTASVGTQSYKEINGVTTIKPNDQVGIRVSGGGFGMDEYDNTRLTGTEANYRVNPKGGKANVDMLAKVHEGGQLGAEFSYTENRQNEFYPTFSMMKADYQTYSAKGTYGLETKAGLTEATIYRNTVVFTYVEDRMGRGKAEDNVTVAKLQHLIKPTADHALRFSGEFRENEINSVPMNEGARVTYDVGSFGTMWDWKMTDVLSFVNAGRFDHFTMERTGPIYGGYTNADFNRVIDKASYNSTFVYKPTGEDTFRLGRSRGYQIPGMIELVYQKYTGIPGLYVYGNPMIEPTAVVNNELSYNRKISEINGDVKLSTFLQQTKDIKSSPSIADFPAMRFRNVGDSESWGGELEVKSQINPEWNVTASYGYQKVDDKLNVNQGAVIQYPVNFEDTTPKSTIKVNAGWTRDKYEADVAAVWLERSKMLRATGATVLGNPGDYTLRDVPSHINVSVRGGYNFDATTNISLTGMNMTEASQVVSSGPEVERRFVLTLKKEF